VNFFGEEVIAIGWKRCIVGKSVPLQILYCGSDTEAAESACNLALDNHMVESARVFRGPLMGGQCMYRATSDNRPEPVGPVLPAGRS
jgi:hypothetical protein